MNTTTEESTQAKVERMLKKKLPLVEAFGPTYQGEGVCAGMQTYFLRFGLCDYDCKLCDSRHAVDPNSVREHAEWINQQDIAKKLGELTDASISPCQMVTFSGGNPCIHDLTYLVESINASGGVINVETQGTKYPDWLDSVGIITISPKTPGMGEKFEPDVFRAFLKRAMASSAHVVVKVVTFSVADFEHASMIFDMALEEGCVDHYLSLGNPYAPGTEKELHLREELAAEPNTKAYDAGLRIRLLDDYRIMMEELLQDQRFAQVTFYPQMHVLAWGNKAEV